MLIRRTDDNGAEPVRMEGVRGVTMQVLIGRADGAPNFSMRQFTVEPGGHTPLHSHNYEHEVVVLEGRGRMEQEGEFAEISAGDVLFVPPNVVHQFHGSAEKGLKFLCLVPTEFDCAGEGRRPTPGS